MPGEGSRYVCLSVTITDSIILVGKNCYPQLFLEKCKYISKDKKKSKLSISDELGSFSHEFDEEVSDEEVSNEEISDCL